MSCAYTTPIPLPPTSLTSCAVPLGGANSTLLDTCCNGEINPIRMYSGAGESSDCYQYCTTSDVASVQDCLSVNMAMYGAASVGFQCFNVVAAKGVENADGGRTGGMSGKLWMTMVGFWALSGVLSGM
ncbi:hypothetical protein CC80DRAFT_541950 [Byssothecium circinans]|uniref:Uncharacterized protein n=1 Tax=Byssothecium circinans TaxID=147558 RepID=A0A6A5UFR8_9PLEO|nr:hypothetical protein CC80DRAFT_541950 [Byssothecium circinans]